MRTFFQPFASLTLRIVFALVFTASLAPLSVRAQSISLITDAEIESMIIDFARPLLDAAGLGFTEPQVFIVRDRRFNAFVTEGGGIFIHYGTIIDSETPNQLKAVLAHEISHLAGGHLQRLRQTMETTATIQAITTILGAGAMAAAGATGSQTIGGVASAFVLASQSAGVNSLMAYRRSEESNADAGALTLLEATRQSARGMVEVLEKLGANQSLSVNSSPYLLTHPLAEDRLNQVREAAARGRYYGARDSNADIRRLEYAKAKLVGFLESQQTAMARYPNSDRSLPARYARIILAYQAGAGISAVQQMPSLISAQPSNPYFHELYGQMLFETGQPGQAISSLRRAVQLAPNQTEIRILYAQALVAAGGETNVSEAITQLSRATREKPNSIRAFIFLGRAYDILGRAGEASLAGAEAALIRGDIGVARGLARQAQQQLNAGDPAWLRADDILNFD